VVLAHAFGGAAYPSSAPPMARQSLLPILENSDYARKDTIYWQRSDGKAIRQDGYRLVAGDDGPWEFYDMRTDKTETANLASRKPGLVQQLGGLHEDWATRVGA